jgi:hypothetical protein
MPKDLPRPSAWRGEYASDSLRVKRQRTDRKVPEVLTTNHVTHDAKLTIGQLRRSRLGATTSVIQVTRRRAAPSVVAGGCETHKAQCHVSGDQSNRALDGRQYSFLARSVGNTCGTKTHSRHTSKNEHKPNDGLKSLVPLVQIDHFRA